MRTDALGVLGKRIRVHRGGVDNFNPSGSVWQVKADVPVAIPFFEMVLEDVEFVVDQEKRKEGIQKRSRTTHAFADGVLRDDELPSLPDDCEEVFFHVFSGPGFVTRDGQQVYNAQRLFLTREGRCFAWRPNR